MRIEIDPPFYPYHRKPTSSERLMALSDYKLVHDYKEWLSNKVPYPDHYAQPDWVDKWREAKTREFESHLRYVVKCGEEMAGLHDR